MFDGIGVVGEFGVFGFEEFVVGWGVEIKVVYFDDGVGY